jgi:hypothetical protein
MQPTWSYAEQNADHASQGLSFHVEALAFRGATLADLYAVAARALAPVVGSVDASTAALATVRPAR